MTRVSSPALPSLGFSSVGDIGQISDRLFGAGQASERLRLLRLENAWGRAVGVHLRSVARPSAYHGRSLVVDVRDAGWKRELDRLKPEILFKLGRLLPSQQVDDISFRVRKTAERMNEASATSPPAHAFRPEPQAGAEADSIVEMSAHLLSVPDRQLRERLSLVMARYLARKPR